MRPQGPALRLTIFIGENDQWHHKPLYTEIVHRAHRMGLAGASVIRGIEGYGASSRIHTEAEASEVIGAARYERSETRTNERNGSRSRTLATQAGDIDLRIPKLRKGSFFPLILEPRRRIDQALYAVVMEAYVVEEKAARSRP